MPSVYHAPYPFRHHCIFGCRNSGCGLFCLGYLESMLRQLCDKHGILLIFDEIQSGMGRSGEWLAAQSYGVTPDILTVAKGIASGFPLSVVVSRHELMEKWPTRAHGTTFGGNPVSCAEAIATIETIRDEGLLPCCCQLGATTLDRLRLWQKKHPLISDVRGKGLMIGMELTQPDGSPAAPPAIRSFRSAWNKACSS